MGPPAQVIKINSGNQRAVNVFASRPAQRCGAQHALLEMTELDAADLQFPDFSRGMEKIEMCVENGNWDGPRHLKPANQQWPVEALSVERNQNRALPESAGKFEQNGIFLGGIAHEELFDLDPARIPPCQSDQKCNISCAPYKSGRFGIEKEPFRGIGCMTCAELLACGSGPEQKLHCARVRFVHGGSCIPLSRRDVLPETISPDLRTQGGPSRDSVL